MRFLRYFFHKHILKARVQTVVLRGRLSEKDQIFLKKKRCKQYLNVSQIAKVIEKTDKPVFLEIGFGNGSHIVSLCQHHPEALVVGSEMYMAGIVNTLRLAEKNGINNLIVTSEDARQLLKKITDNSIQKTYILFPDPWPKARHNKRRLLKKPFFELLLSKIVSGGEMVVATDWVEYSNEIESVLQELETERKGTVTDLESERQTSIMQTTFAVRALKEGRQIYIRKFTKA